jgi:predicted nucleic acid-binding protein
VKRVLLDTGPWVAFLVKNESNHEWAKAQFAKHAPPFLTCEAVLTETLFLVSKLPNGPEAVFKMIDRGAIGLDFSLEKNMEPVRQLMSRFASVPMSLADACLVRMTEVMSDAEVLTLDSDFKIYRRHGRQVVPTIAPR